MEKEIRQNSFKAWVRASRPKTLSGATVPVLVGAAVAWNITYGDILWIPFALCLAFALLMQVASNLVNDYFDFVRGRDGEERLGPRRACAEGWVTLSAMRRAIALVMVLACITGLPLVLYGGWPLIGIGGLCVLFCVLYTTHLASRGFGDLLVIVFFGMIPTFFTFVLCSGTWDHPDELFSAVILLSIATGLAVDALLVINNYRDFENDRKAGKITTVVKMGLNMAWIFYLFLGLTAAMLAALAMVMLNIMAPIVVLLIYIYAHVRTWRLMHRLNGRQLNHILALTSRNMMIFGLTVCLALLLGHPCQ